MCVRVTPGIRPYARCQSWGLCHHLRPLRAVTSAGALASENKHLSDQRYSLYHTQNSHPCRRPCSSSVNYFVILNLRANLARSLNSRRSKLHGSQPCSPTNTLVAHTKQVALQGSASSTRSVHRALAHLLSNLAALSRSYAHARACVSSLVASDSEYSMRSACTDHCKTLPESCSTEISLNPV